MHFAQCNKGTTLRLRIPCGEFVPLRCDAVAEGHFVGLKVGDLLGDHPVLVAGIRVQPFDPDRIEGRVGITESVFYVVMAGDFVVIVFQLDP